MAITCPFCTSKDIWQPFREGWKDRLLAKFGYARAECRGCRRMVILSSKSLEDHKRETAERIRRDSIRFVLEQPPGPPVQPSVVAKLEQYNTGNDHPQTDELRGGEGFLKEDPRPEQRPDVTQ